MKTEFTEAQLADPDIRESNQILRTCVHCGFCTATCPTFVLLGDELDSPRGRIYLIKDMLESGRAASEHEAKHVDRCLSCLSCMTTCPSGVHYMHLVDHARQHIEDTNKRPLMERLIRATLSVVLPRPKLFRAALLGARAARPFKGLLAGKSMTMRRLRASRNSGAMPGPWSRTISDNSPFAAGRPKKISIGCSGVPGPACLSALVRSSTARSPSGMAASVGISSVAASMETLASPPYWVQSVCR